MHQASATVRPFSADPDFDYQIRCALGQSAGDPGEILAAVAPVRKGDHEAWYTAWWELGERALAEATTSADGGHRVSAGEAYLRASAYYAIAVNAVSSLADADLLAPTFAKQEQAWQGFIDCAPVQVDEVRIPYDGGDLPGWIFRSANWAGATLVAVNGSDGSWASVWGSCVAAALKRGYNVLVFDGPGQQSELFGRGIHFRPDWENVLTPVYDFLISLDGTDPARIALYGISQGGYWVARALAFESRYAAAITDPGIVDVSTSWTGHLPASLRRLLDAGSFDKFDREMDLGMRFSPETARTWRFRARPYGTTGYAETIAAVKQYTVADVAQRITTPLLILSPEGEEFWPGQSQQLAELTPGVSTVVCFTEAEGASGHCEPMARSLTAQRMFDWLDDTIAL